MKKKEAKEYKVKRNWVIFVSIGILAVFSFVGAVFSSAIFSAKGSAPFSLRLITTIVVLLSFYAIDHIFRMEYKFLHYAFVVAILIMSVMLSPFYYLLPAYDKMLHFLQPFLLSFIIFYTLPRNINIKHRLAYTFFITTSILGLFEVSEYLLDVTFGWKMQGVNVVVNNELVEVVSRIDDTMIDMILGFSGAILFVVLGAVFNRRRLNH